MGLTNNKRITVKEIYEKVDDGQLFSTYFGEFNFRKCYPSIFRTDENPSTGFYINKNGNIIYNDISTGEKLNIFAFVAKKYGINYGQAIDKVGCDFGILPCEGIKPVTPKQLDKFKYLSDKLKKETKIDIVYDNWNAGSLAYWADYGITQQELNDNQVYPIRKLYINDTFIPNVRGNYRFAYVLNYKDKCYKKIYEPHADKRYKWFNNTPIYLPYGYDSLPYDNNILIVAKSQKERIIWKKYFTNVIGVQNESQSSLRDITLKALFRRFKDIYIALDTDKAGLENMANFEAKGLKPIYIPSEESIKDTGDFVKKYGLKQFEEFVKENIK